eukprot:5851-Heterococcus_DN1.PRE.2
MSAALLVRVSSVDTAIVVRLCVLFVYSKKSTHAAPSRSADRVCCKRPTANYHSCQTPATRQQPKANQWDTIHSAGRVRRSYIDHLCDSSSGIRTAVPAVVALTLVELAAPASIASITALRPLQDWQCSAPPNA